jgi:hypothetical protein
VNCQDFKLLEHFKVVLRDKTSQLSSDDEACRELFFPQRQDDDLFLPHREHYYIIQTVLSTNGPFHKNSYD